MKTQRYGLVYLFGDALLEGQQPKTKRNLVAHLGARVVFDDIHQPGNVISRDRIIFVLHTLGLSGKFPRQTCALHVGGAALPGIERQDHVCEATVKPRMRRGR